MEEEIDLRIYIDILLRWWWLIALGTILTGLVAFGVTSMMTPMYEATAGVVSLKSRVDISLGSNFDSITEDDLALNAQIQGSNAVLDRTTRRLNTLTGMVTNGTIAQQVAEELNDILSEEEADPTQLVGRVRGELLSLEGGGDSDTIQIIVNYDDPVKAATIANAWAHAFEIHVNNVYGEVAYSPFSDIQQQVIDAKIAYDVAQAALVKFLTNDNYIAELQREVAEQEAVIEQLRLGRRESAAIVIDQQVSIQKRLFNTSVAAELNAKLKVYEEQRDEVMRQFNRDYARFRRLDGLLLDAYLIRDQLMIGGVDSASSNGLSLLAFKSKVFGTVESLPFDRLDLTTSSVDALLSATAPISQLADIDALIAVMAADIARLETAVQAQAQALTSGESYQFLSALTADSLAISNATSGQALQELAQWEGVLAYTSILEAPLTQDVAKLEAYVRTLKADIVRLQGLKAELERERELTWVTYQNLLSKEQEIAITAASTSSDVRFASVAISPRQPVSPNRMMNTAVGLAAGGMLGVFFSFLFDYIGLDHNPRQFLRRKPVTH